MAGNSFVFVKPVKLIILFIYIFIRIININKNKILIITYFCTSPQGFDYGNEEYKKLLHYCSYRSWKKHPGRQVAGVYQYSNG